MKMKPFQNLLKTWIAIASVGAFMGGWILLGHSGKPVDTSALANTTNNSLVSSLPTLAPLPQINSRSLQALPQSSSSTSFFQPRLRTRGS